MPDVAPVLPVTALASCEETSVCVCVGVVHLLRWRRGHCHLEVKHLTVTVSCHSSPQPFCSERIHRDGVKGTNLASVLCCWQLHGALASVYFFLTFFHSVVTCWQPLEWVAVLRDVACCFDAVVELPVTMTVFPVSRSFRDWTSGGCVRPAQLTSGSPIRPPLVSGAGVCELRAALWFQGVWCGLMWSAGCGSSGKQLTALTWPLVVVFE